MSELAIDGEEMAIESGFGAYDLLLAGQNMAHPARQGLGPSEYTAAIHDPAAACTEIEVHGEALKVPQLVPLRHIKWLNEGFYAAAFPTEITEDTIMCFNNSLGVEPGDEVKAGLRELAKKQGVIVFDYPESDPDYLDKINDTLASLGIKAGELQELGTQTYFAGKVSLKHPPESAVGPKGLAETFDEIVADGRYDKTRLDHGASLHTKVSAQTAQRMNEFYEAAFTVLNNHPCKQGLSPDEFTDMVANDTEVVKIIYTEDGEVESLCILGEDLSKFDWINPAFYERAYPNEAAQKQIVYFPAIATDPSKQGSRNSEALIELIAQLSEAGSNEMVVAFDCCDINKGFLDVFLEAMINNTPEAAIKFSTIDTQRYCAIRLAA